MTSDGKQQSLLLDKEKAEVDIGSGAKSLKLNIDQTGFYVVHYEGDELQRLVWNTKLSALDKWGLISDAKALLLSGHMPPKQYLTLLERYHDEREYLPAFEISDQLELLHVLAPERLKDISHRFHLAQLKTLEAMNDENSRLLKGIIAGRLTLLDEKYAAEQASKLEDLANVEPD